MGYEYDKLVDEGSRELSRSHLPSNPENYRRLFINYVKAYKKIKNISDIEGHIRWYLDNCHLPFEFDNGKRKEKALEYLAKDVIQFPNVVLYENNKFDFDLISELRKIPD